MKPPAAISVELGLETQRRSEMCTRLIERIRAGEYSQTMTWKVCDALPFQSSKFPRVASALGGDVAAARSLVAEARTCDADVQALADAIIDRACVIQAKETQAPV
jgi:hypothetical protein